MELHTTASLRIACLIGLFAGLGGACTAAEELNVWPVWVRQTQEKPAGGSDPATEWNSAGPFVFGQTLSGGANTGGLRPLYVWKKDAREDTTDAYVLYPLFSFHASPRGDRWSIFSLINSHESPPDAPGAAKPQRRDDGFDVWPVYFSRQTGSPETSYRAVFPVAGSMRNRFMQDRFTWVLFPLYGRWERNNVVTTTAPWPFVKVLQGEGNRGFELWPLFGWRAKEGAYRERFWLWPLFAHKQSNLWQSQPDELVNVLPFYARTSGPTGRSETYLYPFFGYTDRVAPVCYHETRYLWPFLVQGRGDNRYVNRWGPFYTHSINSKGVDKTWVLWPLWKHQAWIEAGIKQDRNQFLYWVWHSTEQRSAANPSLPAAHKTHLWPLFSSWDNGAGRRQFQLLSPFAVLFPRNEAVQLAWDPLFAVYRYDNRNAGTVRHSLLWNLIGYKRTPVQKEFHLGPVLGVTSGSQGGRVSLLCGLFGFKREGADGDWHVFSFEFKRKAGQPASKPQ